MSTRYRSLVWIVFFTTTVSLLVFCVQWNIGLDLADEGYIWHDALRTLSGSIPQLDFRSYEPGRYYWTASGMSVFGRDILGFRLSLFLFFVPALASAIWALGRAGASRAARFGFSILALIWLIPRHKTFDHSLSLYGVAAYFAFFALRGPWVPWIAGMVAGCACFFGRNHGLYLLLSFALLLSFYGKKKPRLASIGRFAGGAILGASPFAILAIAHPRYLSAFWDRVVYPIRTGSTNIALPVPWPWTAPWDPIRTSVGLLLCLLPVSYALWIASDRLRRTPRFASHDLILVSSVLGFVYLHHAFARADLGHLAQVMMPFLVTCVLWIDGLKAPAKVVASTGLVLLTALSAGRAGYLGVRLFDSGNYVRTEITERELLISPSVASIVSGAKQASALFGSPRTDDVYFAPHLPGLYPILGKISPTWDTYYLRRESDDSQARQVAELRAHDVRWAIVGDATIDRREDLYFSRTSPLIWNFIQAEFRPSNEVTLPAPYRLFLKGTPAAPPVTETRMDSVSMSQLLKVIALN